MPLVRDINAVWVPFEVDRATPEQGGFEGSGNVCADIPRFLDPQECKDFIQLNAHKLHNRLIQFREQFETEYKQEWAKGVGRKPGWKYGPNPKSTS